MCTTSLQPSLPHSVLPTSFFSFPLSFYSSFSITSSLSTLSFYFFLTIFLRIPCFRASPSLFYFPSLPSLSFSLLMVPTVSLALFIFFPFILSNFSYSTFLSLLVSILKKKWNHDPSLQYRKVKEPTVKLNLNGLVKTILTRRYLDLRTFV